MRSVFAQRNLLPLLLIVVTIAACGAPTSAPASSPTPVLVPSPTALPTLVAAPTGVPSPTAVPTPTSPLHDALVADGRCSQDPPGEGGIISETISDYGPVTLLHLIRSARLIARGRVIAVEVAHLPADPDFSVLRCEWAYIHTFRVDEYIDRKGPLEIRVVVPAFPLSKSPGEFRLVNNGLALTLTEVEYLLFLNDSKLYPGIPGLPDSNFVMVAGPQGLWVSDGVTVTSSFAGKTEVATLEEIRQIVR
jgi:hypothetical protein